MLETCTANLLSHTLLQGRAVRHEPGLRLICWQMCSAQRKLYKVLLRWFMSFRNAKNK